MPHLEFPKPVVVRTKSSHSVEISKCLKGRSKQAIKQSVMSRPVNVPQRLTGCLISSYDDNGIFIRVKSDLLIGLGQSNNDVRACVRV